MLSAVRTCNGKLFHDLAAASATLKARSPNLRRVLGTRKSDLVVFFINHSGLIIIPVYKKTASNLFNAA